MFFDTETTGLPKNYKASFKDADNWPRIIQFAYQIANSETKEVTKEVSVLIKPDGWVIPDGKFWIDNGFSTEKNNIDGLPLTNVLSEFINDLQDCNLLVAHNMNYDLPITSCEMFRYGFRSEKKIDKFCTMNASTSICKIPSPNGRGFKWPKLEELYKHLFKKDFSGAHQAENDVTACRECFFELKRLGLI